MEKKTRYTRDELLEEFDVIGFGFGYCVVQNKITREKGSFDYDGKNHPRVYFNYIKD